MKKNSIPMALLCAILVAVATSCSEESKFRQFAIDFAHAVNSGDTLRIDSMLDMPGSYLFSKVSLAKVNPDSLQLTEVSEGKYRVTSLDDVCMTVIKDGDVMAVEQTWNVFGSEPESVGFAVKHGFVKKDADDKAIYDALLSEEYATAKAAELEEQKFAQEQEAAQKVIGKLLAEFSDVMNTLQDVYNADPGAVWWSVNQPVVTAAQGNKQALDKQKKYMTPEQSGQYQKLLSQFNRLMHD